MVELCDDKARGRMFACVRGEGRIGGGVWVRLGAIFGLGRPGRKITVEDRIADGLEVILVNENVSRNDYACQRVKKHKRYLLNIFKFEARRNGGECCKPEHQ